MSNGVTLCLIDLQTEHSELTRQRILDAACELFYSRGIRAVSVDEIAAAAQTNKMTLYRHFESKDLLVAEYLKMMNAAAIARDDEVLSAFRGDPYGGLRALAKQVGDDLCATDFRGCPVANAAVEFPRDCDLLDECLLPRFLSADIGFQIGQYSPLVGKFVGDRLSGLLLFWNEAVRLFHHCRFCSNVGFEFFRFQRAL